MKETRKAFMHRHPIMYAIMTALSFLLILYFTAHVTQGIEIPGYGGLLLREESALILTMLVLAGFGMLQEIPWEQDNFMDTLKAGGFVLLLDALLLQYERILMIEQEALPWTQILIFLAFIFLVGLLEETVFRGIIEETLIRSFRPTAFGRLQAACLTGLLFGLAHVINLSWAADPMAVVFQMVQNVVIGIYLSLIYARARNVLAMIFLHAFYDFTSLMMSGIYGVDEPLGSPHLPRADRLPHDPDSRRCTSGEASQAQRCKRGAQSRRQAGLRVRARQLPEKLQVHRDPRRLSREGSAPFTVAEKAGEVA